jgi:hypothetical protein
MQPNNEAPAYSIWGVDKIIYGPVDLPILVNWVQEERVTAKSWIHREDTDAWQKAERLPELKMFFQPGTSSPATATMLGARSETSTTPRPGALRRIRILAGLTDAQLERFARFTEIHPVPQWSEIVKQGSPGDSMYLVLEGEVRVRLMIAGKESVLATLAPGEFFGEVALFDHGPRSADVVANQDSLLLKIPAGAFQRFLGEAPDPAASFLFAMCKTLIARIRADNKRFRDSIALMRTMEP